MGNASSHRPEVRDLLSVLIRARYSTIDRDTLAPPDVVTAGDTSLREGEGHRRREANDVVESR